MEALFTSLLGGHRLRERVVEALKDAGAAADSGRVDVHVMAFSFTDDAIAAALAELARRATVRVIADWSQGSDGDGRQVRRLIGHCVEVRYTHDQPYVWEDGRLRWSYHASRGLLHHKTLGVLVDGVPRVLVCGSYNWTA